MAEPDDDSADTALVERISVHLAERFGQPTDALAETMRSFPAIVALCPTTLESLARTYAAQTRLRHPGAQPDEAALAHLIAEAETIVAPDADEFLRSCTTQVGAMLDSAFNA